MSVSWGTQYAKLKTNLRLAANRLKLLQKKKTEQAMKARTEIADFLLNDKEDRARIRIESIIREDFVVEAYELLEMFCELLLARFGVIQQMKEIDDGIAEAVSSLLWVAPRICHEVTEFKIINDQLTQKYGKQYAEAARMNQLPEPSRVSPKLIQKLGVSAPSKLLVEKYLIEISKCAGVDFNPDPKVMRDDDDEIAVAERNLINFMNEDKIGWTVDSSVNPSSIPPAPPTNPPPPRGSGGGGSSAFAYPPPSHPAPTHPAPPSYPPPSHPPPSYPTQNANYGLPPPQLNSQAPSHPPPQFNSQAPSHPPPQFNGPSHPPAFLPPKNAHEYIQPGNINKPPTATEPIYEVPPNDDKDFIYDFPEPPTTLDSETKKTDQNDDLNFEELAERFKRLTKK